MGLLMTTGEPGGKGLSGELRTRLLVCLQTLTAGENQEVIGELSDLGVIHLLLNMLVV